MVSVQIHMIGRLNRLIHHFVNFISTSPNTRLNAERLSAALTSLHCERARLASAEDYGAQLRFAVAAYLPGGDDSSDSPDPPVSSRTRSSQ